MPHSLFFKHFFRKPCASRDLLLGDVRSGGGEQKRKKKKDAVCLCVALLDMMRDDIMVDAAAAAAVRWGRIPFVSRSLRVMCLSVTLHKTGHWCSSK